MLLPVTGSSGGKTNSTVVTRTNAIPCWRQLYLVGKPEDSHTIRLTVQPSHSGRTNVRVGGSCFRPRRQLIVMGMPYDTPSATTDALTIALNALVEPKKIRPNIVTTAVVRPSASNGTSSLLWTRAKYREKGRPPSRAKAADVSMNHELAVLQNSPYVILDEVVMIAVVAKSKHISGNISRQTMPARLPVAL